MFPRIRPPEICRSLVSHSQAQGKLGKKKEHQALQPENCSPSKLLPHGVMRKQGIPSLSVRAQSKLSGTEGPPWGCASRAWTVAMGRSVQFWVRGWAQGP